MIEAGIRTAEIVRRIGTHRKTIWRLSNTLRTTGSTNNRQRSGFPPVTTRAQDRYIMTSHVRDRFLTAVELQEKPDVALITELVVKLS